MALRPAWRAHPSGQPVVRLHVGPARPSFTCSWLACLGAIHRPRPLTGCRNPEFEQLYTQFTHFNPIQTQVRAAAQGHGHRARGAYRPRTCSNTVFLLSAPGAFHCAQPGWAGHGHGSCAPTPPLFTPVRSSLRCTTPTTTRWWPPPPAAARPSAPSSRCCAWCSAPRRASARRGEHRAKGAGGHVLLRSLRQPNQPAAGDASTWHPAGWARP